MHVAPINRGMKHKKKSIFEKLEGRQMMSATAVGTAELHGGTLTVNGDATQPTNMVLDYSPDRSKILVHAGSLNTSFDASQVKSLVINGGAGADNIFISNKINLPSNIHGGAGNDVIHGGGGDDVIYGGDGNDLIYGGKGKNQIYGEAGNDTLIGQSKNDSLYAGSGNDFLFGGNGNDSLTAGSGNDTLIGGAGNDTLVGGTGIDVEMGGSGNDTITGNSSSSLVDNSGRNTINGVTSGTSDASPTLSEGKTTSTAADSGTTTASNPTTGGSTGTTSSPVTTPVSTTTPVTSPIVSPPVKTPVLTAPVSSNPNANVLNPVITTLDGIRQTGLAVNVDALQSSFGTGTSLTTKYSWNFGDPGSYSNTLVGWNSAHVYDKAGTYTISLTLTSADGTTATATQSVTIAASTRKVIYVDSINGSDTNAGTINAPFKTINAAMKNPQDNTEVLMKAGETFTSPSNILLGNKNFVIGRYGTGSDPVINRTTSGSSISLWITCQGVTIQNVTFDSPFGVADDSVASKIGIEGIYAGGTNITVRNCTFLNVDDAVNCVHNPVGMLVQNCNAPLVTGVRGYFVWGQGSQLTIDGNTVANSTREHNIRMVGVTEATVENNNLTNLSRSTVDPADYSKGCIEEHVGTNAYIVNNTVTDGDIRVGPLGLFGEASTDSTDNCVIENNTLNNTLVSVDAGSHHIVVDNNVINNQTGAAIIVGGATNGMVSDDITITHNTAVTSGVSGQFVEVLGTATNVALTNNLWVAPNIMPGIYNTAAVYSATPDLSDFSTISDNVWPVPVHATTYANGGINLVSGAAGSGYVTGAQWNNYSQVHNDQLANVTLQDTYEISLGDILAGSTMKRAA